MDHQYKLFDDSIVSYYVLRIMATPTTVGPTATTISKASGSKQMGPTRQQTRQFTKYLIANQQVPLQRVPRGGFDSLATDYGNTPTQLYPYDESDTEWALKQQILKDGLQSDGTKPTNVQQNYMLTQRDIDYIASKQEAETLAQFEAYASTLFDFKDPAQVKLFAQIYPQYYKRRFAVIDNVANAQVRYAKLMLTGPQNANDIEFMYLAQSGRVPLISGPLWNPSKWFATDSASPKLALFNPFKPLTLADSPYLPIPGGIDGVYTTPGLPGYKYGSTASSTFTASPKVTEFYKNYPADVSAKVGATPSGGETFGFQSIMELFKP